MCTAGVRGGVAGLWGYVREVEEAPGSAGHVRYVAALQLGGVLAVVWTPHPAQVV